METMERPILELIEIEKRFEMTQALQGVSVQVPRASILGIAGLNGSGKSTLLRIVGGVITPDSGKIIFEGKEIRPKSPRDSIAYGISSVYQELSLAPDLSVVQNVFLGHELSRRLILDFNHMKKVANRIFSDLNVTIDLGKKVRELGIADQQLVEIAKALSHDSKLICFDEPTSALTAAEVERLFRVIRALKANGRTILYVSHNVNELAALCDSVIVLAEGKLKAHLNKPTLSPQSLAATLFSGFVDEKKLKKREVEKQRPILRLKNFRSGRCNELDLDVWHGEVVGLFGLLGSGIEDLPPALFGLQKYSGQIEIDGQNISVKNPVQAKRMGVAYIPPDRRSQGLFLEKSVLYNTSFLLRDDKAFYLRSSGEKKNILTVLGQMQVVYRSLSQRVKFLSGGNQQKLLVGKWLLIAPKIILAQEPFRGIDIVTKKFLKEKLVELANAGVGVLLISNELEEIVDVCDRIVTIKDGKIAKEFDSPPFSETDVLLSVS